MTDVRALQGLDLRGFSPLLPRTPFGATIALRGAACGKGFGACLSCLRHSECRECPQRRNGLALWALRVPLRLFRWQINRLDDPQRCNAQNPTPYMCVCACARAITCATVAALQRCALLSLFLYLPEKKEEKQGVFLSLAATVVRLGVAVGVAAGLSRCFRGTTFEMRGF